MYSIGSRNDFGFEEAVLRDVSESCEIHTFDPTVGLNPSKKPENVHFHPWGLGAENEQLSDGIVLKTLEQIVQDLGHAGRTIDAK